MKKNEKLLGKALDHLIVARAMLREIEYTENKFSFIQDIHNLDLVIRHCNGEFYKNEKSEKQT
jgi:hypothetical protein